MGLIYAGEGLTHVTVAEGGTDDTPLEALDTRVDTAESDILTLQSQVAAETTGLLDRATALETTIDTETTGLVDRVEAAEADITALQAGLCLYAYGTLAYTDTTAKTLFSLPEDAVPLVFGIQITEAFDDTGTDLIDIGVTETADAYVADQSGAALGTFLHGQNPAATPLATATDIKGIYAGQNSNATHGAARVWCLYALNAS